MFDDTGNVFFTWENLAFSMPLIILCSVYAFFKFLPLYVSCTIIVLAVIAYQIRDQMIAQKHKRLETMDDKNIQELLQTEDENGATNNGAADEAARKKKHKVQARLAHERKAEAKKKKGGVKDNADDEPEDDSNLSTFAKMKKRN